MQQKQQYKPPSADKKENESEECERAYAAQQDR